MAEKRVERGIYRDDVSGRWRVYVSVDGVLKPKRLPKELSITQVRRARDDHAYVVRHEPPPSPAAEPGAGPTTFRQDAETYLQAVRSMPTFTERERHISEWVALFGDRPRAGIKPHEIRAQRERWLLEGPRMAQRVIRRLGEKTRVEYVAVAEPLSASAVNQRLRALRNLFTVLDGRHAYNPLREVPEAEPPAEEARGLPYPIVEAILAQMGDTDTRARLAVIAWTGLAHSELGRLKPGDVNLEARTVLVAPRRKGRRTVGTKAPQPLTKPITAEAVAAFRVFIARDCWGPWSRSSMHKAFRRACAKAGHADLGARPYDFRHSFATGVYGASGDPGATQMLMAHRDIRTTMRYARAAVNPRALDALSKFEASLTHGKPTVTSEPDGSTG